MQIIVPGAPAESLELYWVLTALRAGMRRQGGDQALVQGPLFEAIDPDAVP